MRDGTSTAPSGNYSASLREALGVICALCKLLIYLLSAMSVDIITYHQAFRYGFLKKNVHSQLARWMKFLADYYFHGVYRPGTDKDTANFLSRETREEAALGTGEDAGQIDLVAVFSSSDL